MQEHSDHIEQDFREYTVTWSIQVDASNPVAAARQAYTVMRNPGEAVVFEVDGQYIDLMNHGTGDKE